MIKSMIWRRMNIGGSWKKPWHISREGDQWSACHMAQFTAARMQTQAEYPIVGRVCKACCKMYWNGVMKQNT
jgi:hypothetical protein